MNRITSVGAMGLLLILALVGCPSNGAGGGGNGAGGGGTANEISGTIAGWTLGSGYTIEARDANDDTFVYGSGPIAANGSFAIELATPSDSQTQSSSGLTLLGLTVSNTAANYAEVQELTVVDSTDTAAGTVSYGSDTPNETITQQWYYADAATTVSGTFTPIFALTYDSLQLTTGWNDVLQSTDTTSFATTIDNGTVSSGTWSYSP